MPRDELVPVARPPRYRRRRRRPPARVTPVGSGVPAAGIAAAVRAVVGPPPAGADQQDVANRQTASDVSAMRQLVHELPVRELGRRLPRRRPRRRSPARRRRDRSVRTLPGQLPRQRPVVRGRRDVGPHVSPTRRPLGPPRLISTTDSRGRKPSRCGSAAAISPGSETDAESGGPPRPGSRRRSTVLHAATLTACHRGADRPDAICGRRRALWTARMSTHERTPAEPAPRELARSPAAGRPSVRDRGSDRPRPLRRVAAVQREARAAGRASSGRSGDSMSHGNRRPLDRVAGLGSSASRLIEQGVPVRLLNLSVTGARVKDVVRFQLPRLAALEYQPALVTVLVGCERHVPAGSPPQRGVRVPRSSWRPYPEAAASSERCRAGTGPPSRSTRSSRRPRTVATCESQTCGA